MKVIRLNLDNFLTSTSYDPSPYRFREDETPVSEKKLPVVYNCKETIRGQLKKLLRMKR